MKKPVEDAVVCIAAKPIKMSLDLYFQSLSDPKVIYHQRRDVITGRIQRLCFRPDHPPVLILRLGKEGKVQDIYYGYKDYEAYESKKADLFYHRPIATYSGLIFTWLIAPVLCAVLFVVLLNYVMYHWW
jgi:hypothetical protein